LRDRQTLAKLRGARSKDALFALLAGVEARDAA
jgi:PTS system nitrogen regulatory IIA component